MELNSAAPPPPRPPPRRLRDRPVRLAGIVLACSTPVTGFLSYALIAVLFGEARLERSDGLTATGVFALSAPALLGAFIVVWSFVHPKSSGRLSLALAAAVASAALLGAGAWSIATANGDASIGGGLLVLASIPLGVIALVLRRSTSPSR